MHEIGARFCSSEGAKVKLSKAAIVDMIDIADRAKGKETGGILIGFYSSDLSSAWIEGVTPAPDDSRAGLTWFIRGRLGLKKLLKRRWNDGSHYLGEWHSHPEQSPAPSDDDLRALYNIARDPSYACTRPILAILGGSFRHRPLLSVTLGSSTGPSECLFAEDFQA